MKCLVLFVLLLATSAFADDLPRRAAAGLAVAAEEETVTVRDAFPNGAAAAAGLQRGDVLLSVDGQPVTTTLDVTSRLGRHKAGDSVKIEYVRANEKHVATLTMREWPREQGASYDVTYGVVTADGNRYRTLLTKPKEKSPVATIFLVQGVGCGSIDNPPPGHSYPQLVDSLSRRGFATLRVDKPGAGDSEGGPCRDASFQTEVNAYRAALASLKDRENVFLFGHSMGGIMAPLIASAHPSLRGIAVYGTTYRSWNQFMLDSLRRQGRLAGESYEDIAESERETELLHALFYVQQVPIEKILADHPRFRERFPDGVYAAGKAGRYFQQMYATDTVKAWKAAAVPLLAIWGTSDFVSDGSEHELLTKAVNSWRPGSAEYVRLDGIDHWLRKAADQPTSLEQGPSGGEYNDTLADRLASFMNRVVVVR